jgi:SAM-dependent methyltransferase
VIEVFTRHLKLWLVVGLWGPQRRWDRGWMSNAEQSYPFGNAAVGQLDRLRALEFVLDPGTFRHLQGRGVATGWHCLEVGAGAGSVARWLAERVGPSGSVLATDLDTTPLRNLRHPALEVRIHDLLGDPLPDAHFDLVHVRLVLAWLPDPVLALDRLVAALKPGGWLVAEDLDFVSAVPAPDMDAESAAIFSRVLDAHLVVLTQKTGFDPEHGRRQCSLLEQAGLMNVAGEGSTTLWRGGEAGADLFRLTFAQLREPMLATGRVSATDLDRASDLCRHGLSVLSPIAMTAWGQRSVPA